MNIGLRVAGAVLAIGGIALLRRERENAADEGGSVRRSWSAAWISLIVIGVAVTVWAIFAD